jgi:paraquat-inducible protein B
MDVGLKGVTFRTPTLETAIAGGVAFATPDKPGDFAMEGDRFALAAKPENDWLEWSPTLEVR